MQQLGSNWRGMSAMDLKAVEQIAGVVHPGFFERPDVLAEKRQLYPNGAHVFEVNERPAGYVLSHPWHARAVPALDALLHAIPADADTYYLHDLALLPVARRIGAARFMVRTLARHALARGFATMSLVAVNGSEGFWAKQGFVAQNIPELTGKLLTYEEGARYMVRELA